MFGDVHHLRERPQGHLWRSGGAGRCLFDSGPVIGLHFFAHIPDFVTVQLHPVITQQISEILGAEILNSN